MPLSLTVGTLPVGIQQLITAGSQFNGARSTSTLTTGNGMNKYATDVKGGLFDFEQGEPIVVHDVMADFGGSVTYSIYIVNLDAAGAVIAGESLLVATGTAATLAYVVPLTLGSKQAVQLITSGATAAMKARSWATTSRGYDG
jgi:phosphohistidine swiveling domain-containing protein